MQKQNRLAVAGLVVAGLITLGCGAGSSDTGKVTEGGAKATGAAAQAAKGETKKVAKMGADSVTLDGGILVSASKPTKFTPSTYSAGHTRGNSAILVSVTIENKGAEPLDLGLVTVTAAFGKDGTQAESVFDSAKGIEGSFQSTIAAGQKRTAKFAFSAATKDLSLIAITVQPGFDNNVALFEGAL